MPVYEYLCNDCGPFTDMRPMSECDEPQDCPQCAGEAPRVILTAPNFFCMPSDKRKAHATNERSAKAHRPGGLKPAVTRDDMTFGIGENWIGKAECFDRCADLIDLALGMSARITRIGNEFADRPVGDDQP